MCPLNGGDSTNLCDAYLGNLVLMVNTASYCAFTPPRYEGLEALYERYKVQGFVLLGFPSNDFGGQEPGTEKQIKDFCRLTYGVQFPVYQRTHAAKDRAGSVGLLLARARNCLAAKAA